jgi:hypothetical protein
MAYSIVIGVWGTLIYLVVQIVKIRKIGVAVAESSSSDSENDIH